MARSATHLVPVALILAAGCAPQSAELTQGEYWAFLSEETSFSMKKGVVDPADWDTTWAVDCRDLTKKEREAFGLENPLSGVCVDGKAGGVAVEHENWLADGAWHVVRESIEPWRGEAVLTGEGDFQVGFHHRLPGGEDFRFTFVVDPDFQPTVCEVDENGEMQAVPRDGDWIAEWTEDLHNIDPTQPGFQILADYVDDPDAKLYYLNARSFQINPGETTDVWSLPLEWQAGFAAGKFSEEDLHSRASRFATPDIYEQFEAYGGYLVEEVNPENIFYCSEDDGLPAGGDPADSACMQNKLEVVETLVGQVRDDLQLVGLTVEGADAKKGQGDVMYSPMVHDNMWRVPDGYPAGLDGWLEYHFNYVVISGPVEPGGSVHGAFSLLLDGDSSNSRLFVQGKFEVPKVKTDNWTTVDLREVKHEENGTVRCEN